MQTIKSLGWIVGVSIVALGNVAPASAGHHRSYSDITGTNIWNNTAPVFEGGARLDPALVGNVTRLNQDAETAFRECDAAIAQAAPSTSERRFSRQPQTTAAVPEACRRLETLRTEVENLRTTLQRDDISRANPFFGTW